MSSKTKISICIPTYNRSQHLKNCLNSIISLRKNTKVEFQVCISDNCSTDNTYEVVKEARKYVTIKYNKNSQNLGIPRNFLKVVDMANGEFVWIIGDDDLLLNQSINKINKLITNNKDADFFYINSYHLDTDYIFSFPQPFDIKNLPSSSVMEPFSKYKNSKKLNFMDLIDPKISFDFLGGMFLAVFRKKNWDKNINHLDSFAIKDSNTFSHFDNTFPHIKIFSKAFSKSKAYFHAEPLSVCLTGAREWSDLHLFVRSFRLIEALNEYKKNGLSSYNYYLCRNYGLRTFIPDLAWIVLNYKISGIQYIKPIKHIIYNIFYPNVYLSVFYYFRRKIFNLKKFL